MPGGKLINVNVFYIQIKEVAGIGPQIK